MELIASAVSLAVLIGILVGPWVALALVAARFGVDSRSGSRDPRLANPPPWI